MLQSWGVGKSIGSQHLTAHVDTSFGIQIHKEFISKTVGNTT